jgi:hypothetical protein
MGLDGHSKQFDRVTTRGGRAGLVEPDLGLEPRAEGEELRVPIQGEALGVTGVDGRLPKCERDANRERVNGKQST